MKTIRIVALLLSAGGIASATTLNVSVNGQFSSNISVTPLSTPGGTWTISFDVPEVPVAKNIDLLGFDTSFSGFSYTLNGSKVSETPQSVRFSTLAGVGLFTLFFGSESGFDSNGNPIPEFAFQGSQVFSGVTSNPTILRGIYSVTGWTYSDSTNYDQHGASSSEVTIATAVPEPSSMGMLFIACAGLAFSGHRFTCRFSTQG